jgi:signal transduction histidine kinase/ligand-binding sensor domain-containing protein
MSIGSLGVFRCNALEDPAAEKKETITPMSFMVSVWTTGDGLPVNEIRSLKETSDGYLWLGTHRGLVRFDGIRFQSFFTTPTGRRYGTRVEPLELDSNGKLWFAPDEVGLMRLDANGFTEMLTNGTVLRSRVVNLCSDGVGGLMWIDDFGRLGRISTKPEVKAESIRGGGASAMSRWMRDFQGELWLANSRSVKLYSKEKWREIEVPGNAPFTAGPRRAGGLWIAREAKLRFVLPNGDTREIATVPWKGQSRVTCLLEDKHRRLWIGTADQGLYCYFDGQFQKVAPTASSILCLLEDNQDNVWAGTRGGGLVRVRERQFFMLDRSAGMANQFVRSLSQDKAGRIWVVSAEGALGWWKDGVWHEFGTAEGWRGYDSFAVQAASEGSVWISTVRRGLWRWRDGKFNKHDLGPLAAKEPVVDLLEDRHGRLWMVTDNTGIFCLEGAQLKSYSTKDGLPSDLIRQIVEDEKGNVWAGDWEGAVSRFQGDHWELARPASGHQDAIRCMAAADGALWIGTSAAGLLRFKDGKTTRISTEEGLPDACIQQLQVDGRGSLWGGTPHKLFRISLQQLNDVMDGKAPQIAAITYGRSDGLPDISFANWNDPRCWKTRDGELWFATANGAIHFHPDNLQESKAPQPLLEQTLLDGKPVTAAALKTLRAGPGRLEFRFTAPCLTAPERVRFRYQLSGVDPDWVDAAGRSVTYASIPAGSHVFRVLASSPAGDWGLQPATAILSVHPFFWQTNWFLAAVTAGIAGGGVWTIKRATVRRLNRRLDHLRQQHAVDRERARIAQDIHDDLGANLTSIGLLADMGARHKSDPIAISRELDQISQTARESVVAMDAIVWALNPRNDSLDNFANYISQFMREFFRPTQLRTRMDLPANLPTHRLATETRHQLFLLVKESFNNVVRHADATEVHLELACENDRLRLCVADNGKGISKQTAEGGNGLTNLKRRAEDLGGSLEIESRNGHGARLEFVFPLKNLQTN